MTTSKTSKKREVVETAAGYRRSKTEKKLKISRDKLLHQCLLDVFHRTRVYPRLMKPISVHYHFMAYKAVVIIAIVVPRAATMSWDLKKKGAKKTSAESSGSDRTTATRLHSAERGGGRGDRGQWLVQGLRFELKFDAAPRRRFLST